MKKNNISKHLLMFSTIITISLNSIVLLPIKSFAKEEYRLELFSQMADKVTSLYYKEAIVGLDIIDDIYKDPIFLENISKGLENDIEIKNYLLDRGFDNQKIAEIMVFVNKIFPSIEQLSSEDEGNNIIEKIIKTSLVNEDGTLSYLEYEEDIKIFGTELYELMPKPFKDDFDIFFETEEEKRDAMIKIVVEYIYSGHGKSTYNEASKEYVDLELKANDNFIENVNKSLKKDIFNDKDRRAVNIFLKALEETIKSKDLDRVYSDLSSVLNLVETNYLKEKREENIEKDFEENKDNKNIKKAEEKQLNRAETLKLALTIIDIELEEYTGEFEDIDKDDFYADYIGTGKSIGVINGYIDNTFRPEEKVTRSEMMSMLSNAVESVYGEIKLTEIEIDELLKDFKYEKDISPWVREQTARLVKIGAIDAGYSEKFGAGEMITRDEVMKIIDSIETLKNQ